MYFVFDVHKLNGYIYIYIFSYFPTACDIFITIPCAFCTAHCLMKLADTNILLVTGSYD